MGAGFNNATFSGDATFDSATFSMGAGFNNATFSGQASFYNATFKRNADFNNITFKNISHFINTTFSDYADFTNATFKNKSYFNSTSFSNYASFNNATFSGDANFDDATFSPNARFYNVSFIKRAGFNNATFIGDVNFDDSIFKNISHFNRTTFSKEAGFKNATFSGEANFIYATFKNKSYFIKTTFSNLADFNFATFNESDFNGAEFISNTIFNKAKFVGVSMFINTKFKQKSSFNRCEADNRINFENVDLSCVSFLNTDIKNMIFQSCRWFKKYKYGRNKVVDEVKLIKSKKSENELLAYEKVEELYRKLKIKYKAENNEQEVSNWHYGEKEMFRKKLKRRRFNPLSFSNLYWAFSGYGERPIRAGIMLIFLFASIAILMNVFGLISTPIGQEKFGVEIIKGFYGVIVWKKFGLLLYNTIQHALFIKDTFFTPQTLSGVIFLTVSTKLIIPIQVALFVLALRNKFRR